VDLSTPFNLSGPAYLQEDNHCEFTQSLHAYLLKASFFDGHRGDSERDEQNCLPFIQFAFQGERERGGELTRERELSRGVKGHITGVQGRENVTKKARRNTL
jgi:hypothetical protein